LGRRVLLRVAAITTSVRFAIDKLGEINDGVLVFARSKRKVENTPDVNRFHEHLRGGVREAVTAVSICDKWPLHEDNGI
jgi:hypothetical protein